ncbi:hypothetical protein [Yersinia ruckeri]|uniref:hypothetical protein n=1 Tax=Yersinia ruckeri TaxID=29486 RepID=UPI0022382A6E|nr:hypothetical protein [Yersinia ruckeri]MCW6598698.1 hypothetical protein [Yersinia ruckeri]
MSTVTLKIRGDAGLDVATLSELLTNIDPNVAVNEDSIVVDSTKESDVRAILAEVGIDVLENNVNANVSLNQPGTQAELLAAAAAKLSTGFSLHLTATAGNGAWNLIDASGTPIAAIHLSDQDEAEQLAPVFVTDTYGNNLTAAAEQLGVAELLTRTKARLYATHQIKPAEKVDITAAVGDHEIRANHCFDLALKAAQKNVIADPLKQTVLAHLVAQGVENPTEVVTAMFETFPQFMSVIRAQQGKYLAMDASALQATEEMLEEMEGRELKPQDLSPASDEPLSAAALAHRAKLRASSQHIPMLTGADTTVTASQTAGQPNLQDSVANAFMRF